MFPAKKVSERHSLASTSVVLKQGSVRVFQEGGVSFSIITDTPEGKDHHAEFDKNYANLTGKVLDLQKKALSRCF